MSGKWLAASLPKPTPPLPIAAVFSEIVLTFRRKTVLEEGFHFLEQFMMNQTREQLVNQ